MNIEYTINTNKHQVFLVLMFNINFYKITFLSVREYFIQAELDG
jgi:hypothetical protein